MNPKPSFHLKEQLRLAQAWKKGGKEALKAELLKMYPEQAEKHPNAAPSNFYSRRR